MIIFNDEMSAWRARLGGSRLISAAAMIAASLSVGSAIAAELGPLAQITGPSPFRRCTADGVPQQVGTNYPNTVIEPWIASNPTDPSNLLVGWQQDRWDNGGARGDLAGVSNDGGTSWETVVPGKVTKCEGGRYARASDPWVDFSPSGAAFFMHLAFAPDRPNGAFGANAMMGLWMAG
jgi:hypothetical protein